MCVGQRWSPASQGHYVFGRRRYLAAPSHRIQCLTHPITPQWTASAKSQPDEIDSLQVKSTSASLTKRRLAKFNGVRANFDLHLKECEWRWGKDTARLEAELRRLLV